MKTAGIVKIVIGSVLVCLLAVILLGVMLGRTAWRALGVSEMIQDRITRYTHENNGAAIIGSASFPASAVNRIDISWVSGKVDICVGEGSEIIVTELCSQNLSDSQRMRCYLSGGTLRVEYWETARAGWRWFNWRWVDWRNYDEPTKSLRLELPASLVGELQELDVEAVSADIRVDAAYAVRTKLTAVSGSVEVNGVDAKRLSVSTTSGSISVKGCYADELSIEAISGGANVEGSYGDVDAETVSGRIEMNLSTAPRKMKVHSISGGVTLRLPADANFTVYLDTVSGLLSSDIPGKLSSNLLICGDGECSYRVETVSGNVRIRPNS